MPDANDVWSMGIILTKLAGIHHPYICEGQTPAELRQRLCRGEADWRFPKWAISTGLSDLLLKMCEVKPAQRATVSA